jgi:hypothetical protein
MQEERTGWEEKRKGKGKVVEERRKRRKGEKERGGR